MDRLVYHVNDLDKRKNVRNETYFFQCRQCMKRACSICITEYFKVDEICPFCRYRGTLEGKAYHGIDGWSWIFRRVISVWDEPEIDSSDGD